MEGKWKTWREKGGVEGKGKERKGKEGEEGKKR